MRAIALTESADHVCARYRIRAFESALAASDWSLEIEGLERGLLPRLRQLDRLSEYDAVILQRRLLPGYLFRSLRRRARRLVFDFDDAVLFRDSYNTRGHHSARRARSFRRTVQAADLVVGGNAFLADLANRHGAWPATVRVIPTCIETDDYPTGPPSHRDGARLDLVWVGSSSTLNGLEACRPIWDRIGREIPPARLRVICDRFPDFSPLPVVPIAWSEATEVRELRDSDVGVSWIPDDLWSRGKCGLKVLQYQAAALPVIANPVGVHPEIIRQGETGYLAESPDEWLDAARSLLEDPGLRERIGTAARLSVVRRYSVKAWSGEFVAAIAGRSSPSSPKSRRTMPDREGVSLSIQATQGDPPAGC